MIVVDTNVLSEMMRPEPSTVVLSWFSAQRATTLYLTAVTEAELRAGVACMPPGKRREGLERAIDAMIVEDFAGRSLPFDSAAAKEYARIAAGRRRAGRPISTADCQIAGIACAHEARLATRNGRDFEGAGVEVIDPWR